MDPQPPHILCIDASNMLHRFFHGSPEMFSHNAGIYTHALTSWTNLLCSLPSRFPFLPQGTVPIVFFDRQRDLVAEGIAIPVSVGTEPADGEDPGVMISYKGQRKEKSEHLIPQLQLAEHITRILGIRYVRETGHEADTLLGSVVLNQKARPGSVHVLSTDKDMLQLVQDDPTCTIRCIHPQPGGIFKIMDSQAVNEKMGVAPHLVADLLAMMGDACDNIPGIPGVGQKTAINLINTYGGLDGVIANMAQIKGKLGEKIRGHAPYVPALRKLVTFEALPVNIRKSDPKPEAVNELLGHLEMKKTLIRANEYLKRLENS